MRLSNCKLFANSLVNILTVFCVNLINLKFYACYQSPVERHLTLNLTTVMAYKHIFSVPDLSFIPAASLR